MAYHPNWHVITGGPSTGKTSLQEELAKLGYATVEEAARLVIDDAVAKNMTVTDLRADEKRFQDDVVRRRVQDEAKIDTNQVTFLDRGMQDSLAYYRYYNFTIEDWITELVEDSHYGLVFLMEPLGISKDDYARTETLDFTDYITDLLLAVYREYGMEPIIVPPVSVEERVKIIQQHLKA
jgi:predicted ATPase